MKEFIEKLIARLEEKSLEHAIEGQQYGEDGYFDLETDQRNVMQGVDEAISIINQLAEEYKVSEMPTGWKQGIMERFEKVE